MARADKRDPRLRVKPYSVKVDGFDPITFYAASPGKARSLAFTSYTAAFTECTFHRFLCLSTVRRGDPDDGYGERIFVEGKPAFRIPEPYAKNRVRFCWPDGEITMVSHPRDVSVPLTQTQWDEALA